ncbi:MAG: type II toxin-antitoxin system RelE/ParE family toxin [Anaerolineaceae bacterium]|nr:type II toxin-antitoxin system RelE/ParE family toxin [Anaerolineaceae bacterium]
MPRNTASLIREKLDQLAMDPFANHTNVTRLQGRSGFRLRVGDWRVIYEVIKEEVVISVIKIAPRGDVYK